MEISRGILPNIHETFKRKLPLCRENRNFAVLASVFSLSQHVPWGIAYVPTEAKIAKIRRGDEFEKARSNQGILVQNGSLHSSQGTRFFLKPAYMVGIGRRIRRGILGGRGRRKTRFRKVGFAGRASVFAALNFDKGAIWLQPFCECRKGD